MDDFIEKIKILVDLLALFISMRTVFETTFAQLGYVEKSNISWRFPTENIPTWPFRRTFHITGKSIIIFIRLRIPFSLWSHILPSHQPGKFMTSFKYNASLFSINDEDDHVAPAHTVGIESLLSSIPMPMHLEATRGECFGENSTVANKRHERHLNILNAAALLLAKANQDMSPLNDISMRKGSSHNPERNVSN